MRFKENDLPRPGVKIGDHTYYNVVELAEMIGVPLWHMFRAIRERDLKGRKLGKVYLVDAEDFNTWVREGNFTYTKRTRGGKGG